MEVAGNPMTGFDFAERRLDGEAVNGFLFLDLSDSRAAGTEVTTKGWVGRAGNVPLKDDALFLAFSFGNGVWDGNGREEGACIGV